MTINLAKLVLRHCYFFRAFSQVESQLLILLLKLFHSFPVGLSFLVLLLQLKASQSIFLLQLVLFRRLQRRYSLKLTSYLLHEVLLELTEVVLQFLFFVVSLACLPQFLDFLHEIWDKVIIVLLFL